MPTIHHEKNARNTPIGEKRPTLLGRRDRKGKGQRFWIEFQGKRLAGIFWRTTSAGEIIIKALGPTSAHLSVIPTGDRVLRHVANERYRLGTNRRYTRRATFLPLQIVITTLGALAPADDPPPRVTSFASPKQAKRMDRWLDRVLPKILRRSGSGPIKLLKGALGDLLEGDLFGRVAESGSLDIELFLRYWRDAEARSEEETFIDAEETALRPDGPRVGFSPDFGRVFVCVSEGLIIEIDAARLMRTLTENSNLIGYGDYLKALRRKGETLVDEGAVDELRGLETDAKDS